MAIPVTNPNIYALLDQNVPTLLGQPFGFTIGQTTGFLAITSFLLFLILVADGVAAFGRILYALGLRVANSDNEAKLTVANKIITGALFSLFVSFALVLFFISVVNPDIVTGNADFSGIVVSSTNNKPGTPANPQPANPQTPTGTTDNSTENALRKTFLDAGVTINKDPCATPSSTNCTNVAGMKSNIINAVLQLKSSCSCAVQITGGTESGGHTGTSNHIAGNAVDIALTSQLTSFFSNPANNVIPVGNVAPCNIKYGFAGLIFWDEAPSCDGGLTTVRHYHASVTGR